MDWSRDRVRQLRKRAIAEEIVDQQALRAAASASSKVDAGPSKVALRALGSEAVQSFRLGRYCTWTVICDGCGHQHDVSIELSEASTKALECPECRHRQWLSSEATNPPWDK